MLPRPSGFMAGLQYDISARQKKLEKKLYPYGPPYLAEYGGDLPAEVCWGWDLPRPYNPPTHSPPPPPPQHHFVRIL